MKNKRLLLVMGGFILLVPIIGGLLFFLVFHHLFNQGKPSNEEVVSAFWLIRGILGGIVSAGAVAFAIFWFAHRKKRENKAELPPDSSE